jgi:hypothetical protein
VGAYETRHRYDNVDPAEIDTSDLHPAGMPRWSQDQWARSDRSGLLERWDRDEEAARAALKAGEAAPKGPPP